MQTKLTVIVAVTFTLTYCNKHVVSFICLTTTVRKFEYTEYETLHFLVRLSEGRVYHKQNVQREKIFMRSSAFHEYC
ncbi:CLUMA_CG020419, isoform A [Clunio marinus]|uniref:CLUMA_CG020419, isoform A n=1 Tax=Clunio marinus TaxID=568069 RepID=A0A1J1J628_9DIPT|nr:CLUMA_CG020419, isoform A [Clunio marinus]